MSEQQQQSVIVRANKRTFAFGQYLLSGFLPWGTDFREADGGPPRIVRVARPGTSRSRWPLCCGQVLTDAEVDRWKALGLAIDGPLSARGNPTIIAGPRLETWVSDAWHGLRARRWVKQEGLRSE